LTCCGKAPYKNFDERGAALRAREAQIGAVMIKPEAD
jgi:hypothetical protein